MLVIVALASLTYAIIEAPQGGRRLPTLGLFALFVVALVMFPRPSVHAYLPVLRLAIR